MLVNNQGRIFQRLKDEEENHQCEIGNSVEAQKLQKGIQSERKDYHKDAEWLKNVKKRVEQDKDQD